MTDGRRFDLVAFDVDGTLVAHGGDKVVWNLLNERFCADSVVDAQRFERYLSGELTYQQWVDLDIGGWLAAGATRSEMAAVIVEHLYLVPGVAHTLGRLRAAGLRLAIVSGTLDLTLDVLLPDERFDAVFTNRISFDPQGLIAGWEATPYDMDGKAAALDQIAQRFGLALERMVFVGDNINDIAAMARAGLAVAFDPKHTTVGEAADQVIHADLRQLLPLLK